MSEFRYGKEILSSIGEVFKKPILMLPFVYIFLISTIFLFIVPDQALYMSDAGQIINVNLALLAFGIGLIQIILALAFKGMGLIGLRDYSENNEVTCKNQISGGLKIFWRVLLLSILQILIFLVPLLVLFLIYLGVYLASPTVAAMLMILFILLFFIYALVALYYIMFSNVIVAYEGKSAKVALKESYAYAKKNAGHTFSVMLSLFITGLILFVLMLLIYLPFFIAKANSPMLDEMVIVQDIIISLISVPLSAAFLLYLFKAYKYAPGDAEVAQIPVQKAASEPKKEVLASKEAPAKKASSETKTLQKQKKAQDTKSKRK